MATIALVDDDENIVESLKIFFEAEGYQVRAYHDGAAAYAGLSENPPDIAILDIKMHGRDQGFEIARYINDNFDIPFLFLTSFSDRNTVLDAIDLNPSAYLVKPFNSDDIFSTLEVVKKNFKPSPAEIVVRDGYSTIRLSVNDVLWIKSDDKYVEIQTSAKRYTQRGSMATFLESAEHAGLIRVHRSFAINADKVNVIKSNCVIIEGTEIPVSRMHIAKIREMMGGK